MKRILPVILAALLFCGCSFKLPQTGKGNNDQPDESAVQQVGIKGSNGQNVPITEAVIYDRCGVRITSPGTAEGIPLLTVTNSSDKTVKLASAYISADGIARNDISFSTDFIKPGEPMEIKLEGTDGISSLKTRLLLEDEDYRIVEGSLSDVIELTLSDKLYLPSKQLYTLVYEDERLLLGLCRVNYREDSNRVTLRLYAKNKTDKDYCIVSDDVTCDHSDFYAVMSGMLPAGTEGIINMTASTRNSTLSPADLDSITLTASLVSTESYYGLSDDDSTETTESFVIKLPKNGRPETVIPDTVESTLTPEEYISEATSSGKLTPLTLIENDRQLYEDENLEVELVLAALSGSDGSKRCSLHFRVQNRMQKQIALAPVGIVNGATFSFYSGSGIKPMTEQYIEVTSAPIDESIWGSFTDAAMRFEYYYDDGSYSSSSYIGATNAFVIQCSETLSRPGVPKNAKEIYSDDLCTLWLLDTVKDQENNCIDITVYAENRSEELLTFRLAAEDENMYISRELAAFRGTSAAGVLKLRPYDTDAELPDNAAEGLKVHVYVKDAEGSTLSEGEGRL